MTWNLIWVNYDGTGYRGGHEFDPKDLHGMRVILKPPDKAPPPKMK